jgi:hypothetical protein
LLLPLYEVESVDDVLISFGGEIKSLGNGRFGGYLVRFTDAARKDLAGDYFTRETDFGIKSGALTPVYFNHRLPLPTRDGKEIVIKAKIGEGTLTVDEEGVLIDAIVYNREKYEKAIVAAGNQKRLGWSSGSASHLIDREEDGYIKSWPLGLDASLTPIPCEPQNCAIPAKSYSALKFQPLEGMPEAEGAPKTALAAKLTQHVEDLVDDGRTREDIVGSMASGAGLKGESVEAMLEGVERPTDANLKAFCRALKLDYDALKAIAHRDYLQTVKGMFETALSESTPSRWELESVYNKIVSKLVAAASASSLAGITFDLRGKLKEATDEYSARLESLAYAQAVEHIESGSDEHFYLKAIMDLGSDLPVSDGLDLDDHSQVVVSASKGLYARFRANHEARVKSGRVLSDKNRTRLSAFRERLQELDRDIASLLEESTPMASDSEKRAAETTFLRLRWRQRESGVTAHG